MKLYLIIFIFIILNMILYKNINKLSEIIKIFDYPDSFRKKHIRPTPLLGGTFLLINLFIIVILNNQINLVEDIFYKDVNFILFSTLVYFLGIYDDKINIKANIKFFTLLLIVLFLLIANNDLIINKIYFQTFNSGFSLKSFSLFFTVLCIMLFLNACNMFDGINLQLSTYSLQIFIYFFLKEINPYFSCLMIIFLIFFIYYNKDEQIFFGDSGSFLIGFIICFIILSYNNQSYPSISAEEIFLLMALPGIDMFRLFVMRIINKKNPFSPDGNHIHHLFVKKYGFLKATILIQLIITSCLILGSFFNTILIISLLIFIYIFIIYKFRGLLIK